MKMKKINKWFLDSLNIGRLDFGEWRLWRGIEVGGKIYNAWSKVDVPLTRLEE